MAEKNEGVEAPIPNEWRPILVMINEDIRQHRPIAKSAKGYVVSIEQSSIEWIYQSLKAYGGSLKELPELAWETSVCMWMGDYWALFVDLFTEEDGPSDLVLFINVYESTGLLRFKVNSVHVP